jgi:hypothetical protein
MVVGSSARNLPGGRRWLARTPDLASRLSRRCGSVDIRQPYGLKWPVTGIALVFGRKKKPYEMLGWTG